MSVPVSKRGESKLDIIRYSTELEEKIIRMTMNEKYFPKRSRYIIANQIIESSMIMTRYFIEANKLYPSSEQKLNLRREYQYKGLCALGALEHQLNLAYKLFNIPNGLMEELFEKIGEIEKRFKNWQKSDKQTFDKEQLKKK